MRALLLTLAWLLPATLLVPSAEAAPFQTPEDAEFRDKFQKAMKIGARDEMSKLVSKNLDQAVTWIISTSETIAVSPNDVVFERMAALRKAWKDSKGTGFCEKMERYFSLLDPTLKRERTRIKGEYDKALAGYWANNEKKDSGTYSKLGVELASLAEAFTEVGDHYYASQAWSLTGHCWDEGLRGKDADLNKACNAFRMCIESRDKIELKDGIYSSTKPRIAQLQGLGYGKPSGPSEEGGPSVEVEPAQPPVTVEMKFEMVEDFTKISRPNFFLDDLYPTWNSIVFGGKGTDTEMPRLEGGPKIMRHSSSKVGIDIDGDGVADGKSDVDIPVKGKLEPVVFEFGGEPKRTMAFLALTGIERESYQKIEMNLAPVDSSMTIYVQPAGSMVGEINGTSIQIFDEDLDGVYGSIPRTWGHTGLTKGRFQPETDSMVIGGGKSAIPFSDYVRVEDQWYQLEVINGGTSLVAHPRTVTTGTIVLDAKGLKPDYLIIRGRNTHENTFFDLTTSKKVEVPVGRYDIYCGRVSKGKKKQLMKALLLPGDDSTHYDVRAGEETTVEIGAPYGFDWDADVAGSMVSVTGKSVVVVGRGGERYERVWNAVPRPEVSVRKPGSKRGSKGEEMNAALDQSVIDETGDWASVWFPLDTEIPNKAGDEAELQLIEKKNKLFGKIESIWK